MMRRLYYAGADRSSFSAAEAALSTLQHKGIELKRAIDARKDSSALGIHALMVPYMNRIQLPLDTLSIIHVAGTKGKGSVCAMSESVLRKHGFKTGLFTSPHLVSVRERFRIDGQPISEQLFAKYFWDTWNPLIEGIEDEGKCEQLGELTPMPGYFKFLTIMAFNLFIKEKVDVLILEVGIGGRLDPTNIIPSPVVTGVTALGFDHMEVLGDTLPQIAAEKGGIYKNTAPAYTIDEQSEDAFEVLRNCAQKAGSLGFNSAKRLQKSEKLDRLGLHGDFQWQNASLAVALSFEWMIRSGKLKSQDFVNLLRSSLETTCTAGASSQLDDKTVDGLKSCSWPGRCQIFSEQNGSVDYFIDGAHTEESMQVAVSWAKEHLISSSDKLRILVFNCSSNRNPIKLLKHVLSSGFQFDLVICCPFDYDRPSLIEQLPSIGDLLLSSGLDISVPSTKPPESWQELVLSSFTILKDHFSSETPTFTESKSLSSISATIDYIRSRYSDEKKPIQIFVTGSLYLVGGVLSKLNDGNPQ
jgi:folylpolyglutamate synthase